MKFLSFLDGMSPKDKSSFGLNMCQGVISMSRVFTWMALESFDEFPRFLVFEE